MIDDLFIIGDINHVRKIQDMAKTEGRIDIFLKDSDDIDAVYPKIENSILVTKITQKKRRINIHKSDWINILIPISD